MKKNNGPASPAGFLLFTVPFIIITMLFQGVSDTEAYEGAEKWRFQSGGSITASPAIANDGLIYAGSDGSFYAITSDGDERWRFPAGYAVQSSPTIGEDGSIYIGLWDYFLYAITPGAKVKWRFQAESRIASSPAMGKNGVVYIGARDGNLHAIDSDGSEKWRFQTGGEVISSPAVGKDWTVYVGSRDNYLYAVNPDGTQKWRFQTGGAIVSSPAISDDETLYVTSNDGRLYALNPDGTEKWRFAAQGAIDSSPVIREDGVIYFGCRDNHLYAVGPDGSQKWRFKTNGPVHSTPAVGRNGVVYFGSNDNRLYAVDPDGTEKWRFRTGGAVQSSPAIGMDGTVYAGSADGNLYAIDSNSGGLADTLWPMFQQNNRRTGQHPFPDFPRLGSLQVTIEPAEAATAGARWRRAGTTAWYDSGEVETEIEAGDYTVEFKDVDGWTAPEDIEVEVTAEELAEVSGAYEQIITVYTLIYRAGRGGYLTGDTVQRVEEGEDGTPVEAVAHSGFIFLEWTDGRYDNPRTDENVSGDVTVTADFVSAEDKPGTPENPFPVTNANQLARMRDYLSDYFSLNDDIDLADIPDWEPVGTEDEPFTGGVYGNGHKIRNLSVDAGDADYAGLFGSTKDAVIEKTGLENADITGGSHVGGLVGYAVNTMIDQSYVKGFVSGKNNVGGMVGYLDAEPESVIKNSYADCDVSGDIGVGGVVGTLAITAELENVYASGIVEGDSDVGGLVGRNHDTTYDNVVRSYWDIDVGPPASEGGKGETSAYMRWEETFVDWDFEDVWRVDEGLGYPYLKWEAAPPKEESGSTTCFIGAARR